MVMSQPNHEDQFLLQRSPPEIEVVQGRPYLDRSADGGKLPNYPEVVIEETGPSTENDGERRATAVF